MWLGCFYRRGDGGSVELLNHDWEPHCSEQNVRILTGQRVGDPGEVGEEVHPPRRSSHARLSWNALAAVFRRSARSLGRADSGEFYPKTGIDSPDFLVFS